MNNDSPHSQAAFPAEFCWGASTSSYQIEGTPTIGNGGQSIWDNFCRREGAVYGGHTGNVACDHVRLFRDDVALMRELGLQAYRFSISWPRVLPGGVGNASESGLAFYDALVDELLAADIQPWVTLFHWDSPQELQDRGGWLNPESVEWFAEYTRLVVERLSDRVAHWFTLNEPQVIVHIGMAQGIHAPGLQLSLADQLLAAHHLLMAHGRSVQVIREVAKRQPTIGWAPVGITKTPACRRLGDAPEHEIAAARQATADVATPDLWNSSWFNDPVFLGEYPEAGLKTYGNAVPKFSESEMELIATPVDMLGLNIYHSVPVQPGEEGGYEEVSLPPGHPHTAFNWPVVEESLYWGPRFHYERYQTPIVITENGMANVDPQRIDFAARHLECLRQSIADGVDVRGYFHWSLLDNFEWAEGYSKRFGLVHVDFSSQQRTPKDSAYWYRDVIRSNGSILTLRAETVAT